MKEEALSREAIISRVLDWTPTRPVLDTAAQRIILFQNIGTVGHALRTAAERAA